jgi:hypothetical protein
MAGDDNRLRRDVAGQQAAPYDVGPQSQDLAAQLETQAGLVLAAEPLPRFGARIVVALVQIFEGLHQHRARQFA